MPKKVTPSMPLKTATPRARRISAPAPWASTSGMTPKMKASEVIKIGRKRSRLAVKAASRGDGALFPLLLGELDDQDRVLAGQARRAPRSRSA